MWVLEKFNGVFYIEHLDMKLTVIKMSYSLGENYLFYLVINW